jgi:hypothetical protein
MKTIRILTQLLLVLALLAGPVAFIPQTAQAEVVYTCLPTCEENDTRFLTIASGNLATMADQPIRLSFASPADAPTIEIGIFDGNVGGRWDLGSVVIEYTLYADPLRNMDQNIIIDQFLSTNMADNAWHTISFPNAASAQSPGGDYFYNMVARPVTTGSYVSNFKVRTDGVETLIAQPFSYMAGMLVTADMYAIYPNYPVLTPALYNGEFSFFLYTPISRASFVAWDGDLDYGAFDNSTADTDDLDTPNESKPAWVEVPASINFEGVAVGTGGTTGFPSDDHGSDIYRRSPSIEYSVLAPDGSRYDNFNPSGNKEWEQFRISVDTTQPADYYRTEPLPGGLYEIQTRGLDLSNLNAWRFEDEVLGVCVAASEDEVARPCKTPIYPYRVGDTLFSDINGDGMQNDGESGIPGVELMLLDSTGNVMVGVDGLPIVTTTDANGKYSFSVSGQEIDPYTQQVLIDGVYTVQVAPSNFAPGGPLAGWTSTTGGEQQTNTVTIDNVLSYDFGYRPAVNQIGDTVFTDKNLNGIQDAGEGGILNVLLELLDGAGNVVATTSTDAAGQYIFTVPAGSYSVRVAEANFANGSVLALRSSTTGGNQQTGTIISSDILTLDFGFGVAITNPGTGTIGYWKNHPQAWPVASIVIGGRTYTKAQAISIMKTAPKGDRTYNLFTQLVATKLNTYLGNQWTCIAADIAAADSWLAQYPVGSNVKSNAIWNLIADTFTRLDNYNNGQMCAPHRQ